MVEYVNMSKKLLRTIAYIFLAAVLLSALSGCASWDNFRKAFIDPPIDESSVIKIGVYEPVTGEMAKAAADEVAGIELAHKLYGSVLNSRVELVYVDNKSDLEHAAEYAQEMVNAQVAVVIGSYGNMLSMSAGEVFKEAQLPAVAASCTNPLITQTNEFYARACYIDSFEARGAADYIYSKLGQTSAGIMYYEDNDFAKTKAEEFSAYMKILAGEDHISVAPLPKDLNDFSEIFLAFRGRGISSIYLPEKADTASAIMAKAKELGYEFTWIGTSEWKGITTEGACYTVDFDPDEALSSMTQSFLRAYAQKYGAGTTPSEAVALGFDAYLIALRGIREAGDASSGALIARKICTIKGLAGATGSITMDDNGDPIKNIIVRRITNGQPETVYTAIPGRTE